MNELDVLKQINPADLDYTEWVQVGMALKESGCCANDWELWSKQDINRYHAGECYKKWTSFAGHATPVTAGTLVDIAKRHGWEPQHIESVSLDWDSVISYEHEENVVVKKGWLEVQDVIEPDKWEPHKQLIEYLSILFEGTENVGYVTTTWENDGRFMPTKGNWDRTASELIEELTVCDGDIGAVFGDYKKEVGAWIRFNPLDGKGIRNDNVTDYRYALVESDEMSIEQQNAMIRELELPVACLVHSGKKSLHAIVKIEADTMDEYRKRVDFLYSVCGKNGLKVDTQNRNPSRLSRMPGVMRNGKKQYLIDTNIGKKSWSEWNDWIADINDDLPEPEGLDSVWDDMPELAPPIINGVLRQGHKMLLAGPSKAGKSYALIELCCAFAEGRNWLSWQCAKGRVMYVNLELDRPSCLRRFKDVYNTLGWLPDNIKNIDIWNLRGKAVPMDKLAPKLIRRAQKKNYAAIIIDPIYKIITGDENSADQMARFCNQFDRVCSELGAAVIYCHHHSKGSQGGKKSMDRASGSGVFARDPDALLDLMELETNDDIVKQQKDEAVCNTCIKYLNQYNIKALDDISQDTLCTANTLFKEVRDYLSTQQYDALKRDVELAKDAVNYQTAWRIEGTLREFKTFKPVNAWFKYPIHVADKNGAMDDLKPEGEMPLWKKAASARKPKKEKKKDRNQELDEAFANCVFDGPVWIKSLADYMDVTERTVRNRINESEKYELDRGAAVLKSKNINGK